MRQLTGDNYQQFITSVPVVVIHFDAEWDERYREITRQNMRAAEQALGHQAAFAEVDCDNNPELANAVDILNVPAVAYYRGGELVAALIGCYQDVLARTERVMRGEAIGREDGLTIPAIKSLNSIAISNSCFSP